MNLNWLTVLQPGGSSFFLYYQWIIAIRFLLTDYLVNRLVLDILSLVNGLMLSVLWVGLEKERESKQF